MKDFRIKFSGVNEADFIAFYSSHTRKETAEHYGVKETDVKGFSHQIGFKKTHEMIGKSVSKFYETNTLVTIHKPGEFHFIRVNETDLPEYLAEGYILGYEQSEETKQLRLARSAATKETRYGSSTYNNPNKVKQTKEERYGDPNYNNKDKIRETQFELYGSYAFNDFDKVHKTNLEKYGVEHNWSSGDPALNGRKTMYERYGGGDKAAYYDYILTKGHATKLELYGDEFYSNSEQAQATMLKKYGVPFYTYTKDFRDKTTSVETRQKAIDTKRANHTFNTSEPEVVVKQLLEQEFGCSKVYTNYQDSRYARDDGYKFKCDFYIQPLDLFIELNLFPTHGDHPFDPESASDATLLALLKENPTAWNLQVKDVWAVRDPQKLAAAKKAHLNYITIYPNDDYTRVIDKIKETYNYDDIRRIQNSR